MKPVYLNHYFFASFSKAGQATVSRLLRELKRTGYITRGPLFENKPYIVVKLTGRGVLQYYNQLVSLRGMKKPGWWLQHVSQLEKNPRSGISTGGEILPYSGKVYLTQTPGFVEETNRVREEKTILIENPPELEAGSTVFFENIQVNTENGRKLILTEKTTTIPTDPSDLRNRLTHFPPLEDDFPRKNPFVLKGTLRDIEQKGATHRYQLTFANQEGKKLKLIADSERLPENISEKTGKKFYFGPLREARTDSRELLLELQRDGKVEEITTDHY